MKHKIFTFFLALIASIGTIFAASGTCGENLTWNLTGRVLTISGTGAMTNYSDSNHAPWYDNRSSITSVIIEDGVTSIGSSAFEYCNLTSVTIPNSVTSIGNTAFFYCSSLTSITIPNSVTSIGDDAFSSCSGLVSVTIPNSVTSIGNTAFAYCSSLTSITIPNSVTSIGEWAFLACSGLTSVTIPNSVTSIGYEAFRSCRSLTSVTIPNSVTSIRDDAFNGCSSLTSVTIPNSVTSIGYQAFAGCSSLTSVTIPNSVTSIGVGAFSSCSSLTSIDVASDNPNYCSVDGVLFNKDKTTLIQYLIGNTRTEYVLPNSVTSIGGYAFADCSGLTSVTIPNSVTSIGWYAFADCSSLTSVTIPNSVTSIGDGVFAGCSSLTSVTIPNSVTSIELGAFSNCSSLTAVTIGNSVTSIGKSAFAYCSSLTSITCEAATPPTCREYVFYGVDKSIPVYVPAGSVATYKAADQWKDFGDNIQPIQAPEADVTDVDAEPTDNSVVIEWPAVTGATVYTINIYKGSDLICTLSFNGLGQLLSISLAKKANGGNPKTAVQTATGWQYSIDGLETGTTYSCTVIAKNGETPLYSKTVSFITSTATAIDQITNDKSQMANKIIKDNQLLIIRDGKTYSVQGAEVQ